MKSPKINLRSIADDFKGLPQDVAVWPLAPRVACLLALMAMILAAGWWFLWDDQLTTLEQHALEEQQLKEEFKTKKTQAVNKDLYVQQLSEIDRSFGMLLKQLPSKSEVESLLVEINQSGMGRGLQFELFKPDPEIFKEFYAELPIKVRLIGNYHDLGAFAGDIAKLSRIVTLNDISIEVNKAKDKEGALVMDAITKTFRYLDDEELAAKKKAEQGAKGRRK